MAFFSTIRPKYPAVYQAEEREKTIEKTRLGCKLGIVLVLVFGLLDFAVFFLAPDSEYREKVLGFFALRVFCACLMAILYYALKKTVWVKDHYDFAGLILLLLPSATISWIIYATKGSASTYYAGLTLVLMFLAVVLDWTFWQSVVSVVLVLLIYVVACLSSRAEFNGISLSENLFFLTSSSIAIIAGTIYHSRSRIREFNTRMDVKEANEKLEQSRNELAVSLQQLEEKQAQLIQSQIQLVQSEKLASFGLIAAGIMHEINNALTYPKSGLRYLERKSKNLEPEQEADQVKVITKIKDGLDFVGEIVSGLQDFANPNTDQIGPIPVAEVVSQAKLFLSDKWQGTVHIEVTIAENQTILANKTKLIQVLMILLNNSLDALKAKHFTEGEKPTVWIEGRIENGQSILSVRDNGPGIAEQDRLRIYEPFFTTKGPGSGTGLGLSICKGIVEDDDVKGEIEMISELGKFCEFTLKFPACQANRANN